MKPLIFAVILLFCSEGFVAQVRADGGDANPDLKTNVQALKNWQSLRFGMFIHWGPVTLRGTEIGWSRGREVPIEEYDNLYKEFNPVLFNAKEWVATAKAAGMKYLIITSKHHDGFCLWDSKYTDYDIMSSPFNRDVLKELSEECKRQGILFGTYYSILDWHHPDYTTRHGGDPRPIEKSDMNRYIVYMKNQLKELVENYRTNILWFDGEWEDSWDHEKGMDLYGYVRGLRDDILINNRVDKGRRDMQGMTLSQKFAGDFGTPEQRVGTFEIEHPWESCITICRQWAWKPNDRMKSLRECIQTLAKTAGGGGNLLLNVGPMLDGRIEQRQIDRLKQVGEWLKKNGESIYGTRGGPFKPTGWMVSTRKENKIFVHLLGWPEKKLILPELRGYQVVSAHVLQGEKLNVSHQNGRLVVALDSRPADVNDTVLVLELDRDASDIEPLKVPENILRTLFPGNLKLLTQFSNKYRSDGVKTLVDRIRGSRSYSDGHWLGYEGDDFNVRIDLKSARSIHELQFGCLQNQNSLVFWPKSVKVSVSSNGERFRQIVKKEYNTERDNTAKIQNFTFPLKNVTARFVKLQVRNVGKCPSWHKSAGRKAWLFVDEIAVE